MPSPSRRDVIRALGASGLVCVTGLGSAAARSQTATTTVENEQIAVEYEIEEDTPTWYTRLARRTGDDGDGDEVDLSREVTLTDGVVYFVGQVLVTDAFSEREAVTLRTDDGAFVTEITVGDGGDVRLPTGEVDPGLYVLEGEIEFELVRQAYDVSPDEASLADTTDDAATAAITVSSNRAGYVHVVDADDLSGETLASILDAPDLTAAVQDADGDGDTELVLAGGTTEDGLTIDISGVDPGVYTIEFAPYDADAGDTLTVTVAETSTNSGTAQTGDLETVADANVGRRPGVALWLPGGGQLTSADAFQERPSAESRPNGYEIVERYGGDAGTIEVTTTVSLPPELPAALARLAVENVGGGDVEFATPSNFVADGIYLGRTQVTDPTGEYRFHYAGPDGPATEPRSSVSEFDTLPLAGPVPYVAVSDDRHTNVFGQLAGETPALEGHVENDRRSFTFTVEDFTLPAGETYEWTLFFGALPGTAGATGVADLATRVDEAYVADPVEAIAGDDGTLSGTDVLRLISAYNAGRPVEGTLEPPSATEVLRAIAVYNSGGVVG